MDTNTHSRRLCKLKFLQRIIFVCVHVGVCGDAYGGAIQRVGCVGATNGKGR